MAITRFPKDKVKTPAEWQSIYMATFKRELFRTLPWIVLVPAVLLGAVVFHFAPTWQELGVSQIVWILFVYAVLATGLWMVLGPYPPRRSEGEVTRRVLDAARKRQS